MRDNSARNQKERNWGGKNIFSGGARHASIVNRRLDNRICPVMLRFTFRR